jgi:hypothetical protein
MCEDKSAMKRGLLKSLTRVTPRLRSCAALIALALLASLPLRAQTQQGAWPTEHELRITSLLAQLADLARTSSDAAFAARAQARAASLLWPHDRERARVIFRRAFDSLAEAPAARPGPRGEGRGEEALADPLRRQLQAELLNLIARRDPELAENIARSLAPASDGLKDDAAAITRASLLESYGYGAQGDGAPGGEDADAPLLAALPARAEVERRELLVSVALQIVERDPPRAMTLAQLSLGAGISANFGRLLALMRGVDAVLADLLFSSALARMGQPGAASLVDIHVLGSYLVSSAGLPAGDSAKKSMAVRFLRLAFDQVMRYSSKAAPGGARGPDSELESSAVYFIGRQLAELFALYLPDKLPQLKAKISELNGASAFERVVDPSAVTRPTGPADAAREARESSDEGERSALYARAALGWLASGEVREAEAAALRITNADMRDRVLIQIARRQTSDSRIDEAVALASRIEDDAARLGVIVRLAGVAISAKDRVRATELLNQAEREALRMPPTLARSQALLTVVSSFSSFDVLRAFEVMQTAVKAINGAARGEGARHAPSAKPAPALGGDELYHLNFEGTLAVLARADFDRALLLARQLTANEVSVAAQLAVCRGGLALSPAARHPAGEEEAGPNIDY